MKGYTLKHIKEHWKRKEARKEKRGCGIKRTPLKRKTKEFPSVKKQRGDSGHATLRKPSKPLKRTPLKKGNKNAKRNSDFYRKCWDSRQVKQCENCGLPLLGYSATFISHILSKGAFPGLADHPLNWNLLCFQCHQTYEFGDRKSMKIYPENERIITRLKSEYYSRVS